MNRTLFTLCSLLILGSTLAQDTSRPSMSPNEPSGRSNNRTGLGALQNERPKGAKTEITALDEATFDNDANLATFKGKVVVVDPQFKLYCDELRVYLNANRKGLDRAEAEGSVIIVQENVDERGDPIKSIGRSTKAVFEPETGDITLSGTPSIQQGINNHIAITPETVMILNRAGKLRTIGASRTTMTDATEEAN